MMPNKKLAAPKLEVRILHKTRSFNWKNSGFNAGKPIFEKWFLRKTLDNCSREPFWRTISRIDSEYCWVNVYFQNFEFI
jgi:hypothetical protein